MSHYHPPNDEALEAHDRLCWALCKGADETLYEAAKQTIMAFCPFAKHRRPWPHLDAALALVVTTAEPWDAVLLAAELLENQP